VGQVLHRFGRRRAPESALARLAPISNRFIENAALRVMMGKNFRLRLADLWKALLERLADPEVQLLPLAPQQRAVGRVLDQGVLENERLSCGGSPRRNTRPESTSCPSVASSSALSWGATAASSW
jgi:hypothetical protein